MEPRIDVQPLPYKTRQRTFSFLLLVFVISLPFLYLYATGYRFDFEKPTNLVSTGGMYVAVDRTGAEIYIDGELVRETRTFRKAFYAQSLDIGTHRVNVQKEGHHTWVKELPVSKHLVTEAQAFNLPLVPQVRVIAEWQSATGSMIVPLPLTLASSTNELIATTTRVSKQFVSNEEYRLLVAHFATTSTSTVKETTAQHIKDILLPASTSTPLVETAQVSTTTVVSGGVKLHTSGDDLYATWVGSFEQMPYYYCAESFPAYSTSTEVNIVASSSTDTLLDNAAALIDADSEVEESGSETTLEHPVQTIPLDTACVPSIRIDRKDQSIRSFDFLPGSTDFVIMVRTDGIYMIEIDDRAWQNVQPILMGTNLHMYIENGNIYVYDGTLIYQVIFNTD